MRRLNPPLINHLNLGGTVILVSLVMSGSVRAETEIIRGLVKPQDQAVLSSEIDARVTRLPFRAGDGFDKDDVLVEFDCSLYRAQLAAAEADRALQASEFENAQELLSYKATSPLQVEVAENELKQAQARYEIEKLRVAGCRILAPYSGRVVQVLTNEHETINRRTELLSILSDARLEIELIIPSSWLGWLQTGHELNFRVDETGTTYPATVVRVGAMVDPVSQTAQVVATFDDTNRDIRPGMSGDAMFSAKP